MPPTIIDVTSPWTRRITDPGGNSAASDAGTGRSPLERSLNVLRTCRTSARRTGVSMALGRLSAPPPALCCSLELPAGGIDVTAARSSHGSRDPGFEDNVAEGPDSLLVGAFVRSAGPGVER